MAHRQPKNHGLATYASIRQYRRSHMRGVKIIRNSIVILFFGLMISFLWLVMPAHLACKNSFEGETLTTLWGDTVTCDGESMDVTSSYFQGLIGCLIIVILLFIFCQLVLKKFL